MLDFFWFWREEVNNKMAGRHQTTMFGLNLGNVQSANKTAHLFVINGRAANDSDIGETDEHC